MEEFGCIDDLGSHPLHLFHYAHSPAISCAVGGAGADYEMRNAAIIVAGCIVNATGIVNLRSILECFAAFCGLLSELFILRELAAFEESAKFCEEDESMHDLAGYFSEEIVC